MLLKLGYACRGQLQAYSLKIHHISVLGTLPPSYFVAGFQPEEHFANYGKKRALHCREAIYRVSDFGTISAP
jgi:hypothetical protein